MRHDQQRTRHLTWPTCFNARDLGGYETTDGRRTRWGALIRADNMCHLTEDGRAALIAYGVRTVVDLLSQSDHSHNPPHPFHANPGPGSVPSYIHVPLIDETDKVTSDLLWQITEQTESYRVMLSRCRNQIARAVRAIAAAPLGGVVFHCHAGRDRTGLVAALLLALARVPIGTIARDYALSEERLEAFTDYYRSRMTDPAAQATFGRLTAPPELMLWVLGYLESEYGGAEAYLRAAGIDDTDLRHILGRFVE